MSGEAGVRLLTEGAFCQRWVHFLPMTSEISEAMRHISFFAVYA